MVQHELIDLVPSGFVSKGPAPTSQVLKLRLALVQNNIKGLEDALMAVSSPGSPKYRQFLTKEETEAFVAPTPESVDAVTSFLSAHGITATKGSPAGDWLNIDVTVAQADALFDGQFTTFEHTASGTTSVRSLGYSIPASLKGHLDFVHPTITFPQDPNHQPVFSIPIPRRASLEARKPGGNITTDAVPASCASEVTPACLQALYGIPATMARPTGELNRIGVSGFFQQFPNKADLKSFLTSLRPDLPSTTNFTMEPLNGGTESQVLSQAGVEADLDIQYTIGVASGLPTTFFSVGSNGADGAYDFVYIANFFAEGTYLPQVFTTSYGFNEPNFPQPLAVRLCNAYTQLGGRGTTVLFSSGDGGVSGSKSGNCTTFVPTFPSGCPFITSVGATTGIGPEVSASFSSGGFSNYFQTPPYQSAAVSAYLTRLGSTNAGRFNIAGRGFPDVSVQGENVKIFNAGSSMLVSGTGASTAIFAGVIALLNNELEAVGKHPLGFLNPLLYSNPGVFTDITSGSNPGCGTNGFPATPGWDPVTGLGTPNYAALKKAVGL
ncbi:subtilisin-like protein [Multifurca ochricompacta]|uniref:Subtilisin-like protein n=1 Tax=Multifurca ochricompacta TaxID=376703 RepID=A0AAD4LZU6_9AGAM|nr:subtilisin-like protein [Multifurca ochricompacta]